MEHQAPSLGDQFACLRDTAQARKETCAWIPGPIHALIMAALVRIFDRLDQLLRLWQAGALPAPAIRPTCQRSARQACIRQASGRLGHARPSQAFTAPAHPGGPRLSASGQRRRSGARTPRNRRFGTLRPAPAITIRRPRRARRPARDPPIIGRIRLSHPSPAACDRVVFITFSKHLSLCMRAATGQPRARYQPAEWPEESAIPRAGIRVAPASQAPSP